MPEKALLIVDVQKGFINKHTEHIPSLVEKLQKNYELVFATQFINQPNSQYHRWLDWNRFLPDSEDIEFAFMLRPDAEILKKSIYTCVNEDFLAKLTNAEVRDVDICGIDTDVCVSKCATDLFEDGRFRPVVLEKYSASHAGNRMHRKGLAILRRLIGEEQIQ